MMRDFINKNSKKIGMLLTTALVTGAAGMHAYVVAICILTGYVMGSIYEIEKRLDSPK